MRSCLFLFYLTLEICNFRSCNVRGGKQTAEQQLSAPQPTLHLSGCFRFHILLYGFMGAGKLRRGSDNERKTAWVGWRKEPCELTKCGLRNTPRSTACERTLVFFFFFFDLFSFEGSHMPYKEKVKQQQENNNNNTHTNNKKRYEREACHTTKLKRKEKMGILSAFLQFEHGAGGHNSYSSFFFLNLSLHLSFFPLSKPHKKPTL